MKILAIDTTSKFLTIAFYNDGKAGEYNLETGRRLSEVITLTIKRVLDASGITLEEVDYFACGTGPGSFTGIRTGISTIKGLSWVTAKPVIGVSTLDILAYSVKETEREIVPAIDAKRGLIYCGIYNRHSGSLVKRGSYMLISEEELCKRVRPGSILLGDALSLYREGLLKNIKGARLLDKDYWYPKAHNLIDIALERIQTNKFENAFNLKPIYLYPKECQIKKAYRV